MKIIFLGTRGNITIKSSQHHSHSALLISYARKKIMIDCGEDFTPSTINNRVGDPNKNNQFFFKDINISIDSLFITHAHSDHAGGLKYGAPCPVYASAETWNIIKNYPIAYRYVMKPYEIQSVGKISVQMFPVLHSINAPAVGYRITAGKRTIFYVPDLIKIKQPKRALSHIDMYIGDGAIITRKLLMHKRDSIMIGHAPISEQLKWCARYKVPRVMITHCGTEIVSSTDKLVLEKLRALDETYTIRITLAHDGMNITL